MPRITYKTLFYGAAGALGGSAAWAFVLALSRALRSDLLAEIALGALVGICIGGFIWSHEAITGRQFGSAVKRAAFGAMAGMFGGALGAGLGNTVFSALGKYVADLGGFRASLGIALSAALGWAVLGAAIGISGGIIVRSRDRALYGLFGGSLGGLLGGLLFTTLSATNSWSALAGLLLLGCSIGAFISLVEEAFVSATVKVIKGRHVGREFPLLKELNFIGRDDRSDVCLSGAEGVAVQHAGIRRDNGHFLIETDEEGKPVYVNEKMTRNSRLADGDIVRVGSILLLFSAVRKAAALAAVMVLLGISLTGERTALAAGPASVQITQFDLSAFPAVKAYVSVLDGDGKPVRGLSSENVTLSENGRPVAVNAMQMTGTKGGGKREPLSLAIVVDRSQSMTGDKIEHARTSVDRFLSLMEQGDRAALIAFSDRVAMLEPLSGDRNKLSAALRTIEPGGHTALYDAVAAGVASVQGFPGRRAVIVLTDGIANRGALDIDQAIATATKEYVSVFVIGLGKDVRAERLERIAIETGGSYFFTPSPAGLADIYENIGNRIRNEYAVTFVTEKRAAYLRNLWLTLSTGQHATRSYFQPQSSLFGAGGILPPWAFAMPLASILGLVAVSFRKVERHYETGHLSLVRGTGTKKDIDINSNVTIGRGERNTLGLFKDSGIDQQHAEIVRESGRYLLEDKGSASGTYVNKTRVAGRQALQDGDVITVGNATIVFSEETRLTCAICGSSMRPKAKFCGKCGAKAV
jgi:VWFA-related protein